MKPIKKPQKFNIKAIQYPPDRLAMYAVILDRALGDSTLRVLYERTTGRYNDPMLYFVEFGMLNDKEETFCNRH